MWVKHADLQTNCFIWNVLKCYREFRFKIFSQEIDLHNHDAWAAEMRTVSSGFRSKLEPTPVNDGITIEGNPLNSPMFIIMKFLANDPNN